MLKPPFWVIVGVLVLVVGCGDRTPPVMSDLTFATNPSGRVPLAAVATLTTDEAAQVTVEVTDGEDTWIDVPRSAYHIEHSVMVLGLQPERAYRIVLWRRTKLAMRSGHPHTRCRPLRYRMISRRSPRLGVNRSGWNRA